jgi:hypothetical protein
LLSFWFYFTKVKKGERKEIPKREEIKKEKTIKELLENLTPKEPKPLTDTEKEEIEKALQSLTPEEQKPKVSEKIEEGLLEQLTPK